MEGVSGESDSGTLLVGISFVIGYSMASAFFLKRIKRRTLLVISAAIMAFSTAFVAVLEAVNLNSNSGKLDKPLFMFENEFLIFQLESP